VEVIDAEVAVEFSHPAWHLICVQLLKIGTENLLRNVPLLLLIEGRGVALVDQSELLSEVIEVAVPNVPTGRHGLDGQRQDFLAASLQSRM